MRKALLFVLASLICAGAWAQNSFSCSCGANPPGPPAKRTLKPYTGAPQDLRPFSKFTEPYYEHYEETIEYNGAARDLPDPEETSAVNISFIGPLYDHPEQALGQRMLHGAQLAIDEANAAGGYCGKPFKLILHNDSATWGAASNEVVKSVYEDKSWAMFGSISGDTTHIALRVALKAEIPLVNSAATDPTIPETLIPWYFTTIQDDRVQGYTLARHIFTELGLKRVALLRVNDRYGRFGVGKFRDASRRLGRPVVIEQKFMPGDTDFRRQLRVIQDSRADAIVLWTDEHPAAMILQQMKELGMKQRVFGSHRTLGEAMVQEAGTAAEGIEAVYPYNPAREDARWKAFNATYEAKYGEKVDHFSALSYDAMQVLLGSICKAGLNRGRIRDSFTALESYGGVTGDYTFDTNCKNVTPMFLGAVRDGKIVYRQITMEKPYARVGEDGVRFSGPSSPAAESSNVNIAVFGPRADQLVNTPEAINAIATARQQGLNMTLIPIPSETQWGKSSTILVDAIYKQNAIAIVAVDRNTSHLAEQIALKAFIPVLAISDDKKLTSTNVPWIFRMPGNSRLEDALRAISDAVAKVGSNPGKIRDLLASGSQVAGLRFADDGEPK
jgi:branched-chain amino acid transport system substrate-binding protein